VAKIPEFKVCAVKVQKASADKGKARKVEKVRA
jgi:hypothetical protein